MGFLFKLARSDFLRRDISPLNFIRDFIVDLTYKLVCSTMLKFADEILIQHFLKEQTENRKIFHIIHCSRRLGLHSLIDQWIHER